MTMGRTQHSFLPKHLDRAFRNQACFSSVAYTTYFLFGIMRGYPAFLVHQLKSSDSLIPVTSTSQISWIASLSIFPNPFGSILAGFMMDQIGRKITLQLSMAVFAAGWMFIYLSHNLTMLYVGNIIVGVAIGMGACSTIYVAEICQVKNRCMLLSLLEVYFALGILVAYVSTCYLKWNIAALVFTIFSVLSLCLLSLMPETPYWLIKKNRIQNAVDSFDLLRNKDEYEENNREFKTLCASLQDESESKVGLVKAFSRNLKAFWILVAFHLLLQGCGFTILLSYLAYFIKRLSVPGIDVKKIGIGYSISSFVSSFLTPFTVNYLQRREATIMSGIGIAVTLGVLGVYNAIAAQTIPLAAGSVVTSWWFVIPVCLYLYLFSCTIGVLTLSQAMIGELYPTEVRGMMCGMTEAVGTILSGISVKLFPIIEETMNESDVLYLFSFFGILTVLFGKYVLPETYGKSLAEIQNEYFRRKSSATVIVDNDAKKVEI